MLLVRQSSTGMRDSCHTSCATHQPQSDQQQRDIDSVAVIIDQCMDFSLHHHDLVLPDCHQSPQSDAARTLHRLSYLMRPEPTPITLFLTDYKTLSARSGSYAAPTSSAASSSGSMTHMWPSLSGLKRSMARPSSGAATSQPCRVMRRPAARAACRAASHCSQLPTLQPGQQGAPAQSQCSRS